MHIYLASQSPRRQQLLQQIGVPFTAVDVRVDETWNRNERADAYVCRLALEKARSGLQLMDHIAGVVVMGADTAVVLDDEVLGKAADSSQAAHMLRLLSGRQHLVYTAVAVVSADMQQVIASKTAVCFRSLSGDEISQYCASGEPAGKAGGYAIQGRAAVFVESIQGSYSGVVGLPLYETWQLLAPLLPQPPASERRQ